MNFGKSGFFALLLTFFGFTYASPELENSLKGASAGKGQGSEETILLPPIEIDPPPKNP